MLYAAGMAPGRPRQNEALSRPVRRRRKKALADKRDLGTPEGQEKRRALVGDADPALATCPLGVLLARGIIDREQYEAGERYAFLRWSGVGKPFARTTWPSEVRGVILEAAHPATGLTRREQNERRYQEVNSRLLKASGHLARSVVFAVAVEQWLPKWASDGPKINLRPKPHVVAEMRALVEGLEMLTRIFGTRDKHGRAPNSGIKDVSKAQSSSETSG